MSNILVLQKLQRKLKIIYLSNYKQLSKHGCYNILLNSNLCIPPKNKITMFSFSGLILK